MGTLAKLALAAAGVAAVVVLFVVLRPDASDSPGAAPPATTQTGGETATAEPVTTSETETEAEPEEPPGPRIIRLSVREGEPEIERVELERGERVVLIVRSHVVDHVHLHGYDVMRDVAPGRPARLAFRATVPGRFVVELEDRHQQIAQLSVQ